MPEHTFGYVVIRESDKTLVRHGWLGSARNEAARLTVKYRQRFCVLKPVLVIEPGEAPIRTINLKDQDDFYPEARASKEK